MNINLLNSTPYANGKAFLQGCVELATVLGLKGTYNEDYLCTYIHADEANTCGIQIKVASLTSSSASVSVYLYNSTGTVFTLNSVSSAANTSYIYYVISEDKTMSAFGFNSTNAIPQIEFFITKGVNVNDSMDVKTFFGAQEQDHNYPNSAIITDTFYEREAYSSSIPNNTNLVVLAPYITLRQNETYKLNNIFIATTFLDTTSTREFLLNEKYYISAPVYQANNPRWVIQI